MKILTDREKISIGQICSGSVLADAAGRAGIVKLWSNYEESLAVRDVFEGKIGVGFPVEAGAEVSEDDGEI